MAKIYLKDVELNRDFESCTTYLRFQLDISGFNMRDPSDTQMLLQAINQSFNDKLTNEIFKMIAKHRLKS